MAGQIDPLATFILALRQAFLLAADACAEYLNSVHGMKLRKGNER